MASQQQDKKDKKDTEKTSDNGQKQPSMTTIADIMNRPSPQAQTQRPIVVNTGSDDTPNYVLYIGLAVLGYLALRRL